MDSARILGHRRPVERAKAIPERQTAMNVLLVSANIEQITMPVLPLGLACVATATRAAGHEVVMVDLMEEDEPAKTLEKALIDFSPDAIGISVRNIDDQKMAAPKFLLDHAKEVVGFCRDLAGAPIILGGAGYSIYPESVLNYTGADMGIQGEGEAAFLDLLERLGTGGDLSAVPGLCLPGSGMTKSPAFTQRLDAFSLPDLEFLMPSAAKIEQAWIPIQTRRGCPLKCSYCSTPAIEGTGIRQHSPGAVIGWISHWVDADFKHFVFVDNTFNLPPSYAKALCRMIADHGLDINWFAIVYPKDVDEELAELMARAGCVQVVLGFESGSEGILKNLRKTYSLEEVRETSERFARHGIKRMGTLMFGAPGENRESVKQSLEFTDSLGLDMVSVNTGIRIYPDTPLADTAVEEGRIPADGDLLQPSFYFPEELNDWLPEVLNEWKASRDYPVM